MAKAKVAYTLTCPGPGRHKFGVNGLVLVHNGPEQSAWAGAASLFTAGRDATVRRWDVSALEAGGSSAPPPAHAPACVATYADHSDWVNDIVVAREHGLLISASSDHTLKLWSLDTPGSALPKATVHTHTDYVKALAYAPAAGIVVSASLDKRIHIYQLDTLRQVALNGGRLPGAPSAGGPSASGIGGDYAGGGGSGGGGGGGGGGTVGAPGEWSSADGGSGPIVASGHVDSIYSVAVNSAGTLIASGSVEPEIRLWDARTGRRAAKLVGHSNLVRALVLDADGRRLLSASSDRTVRLWDVGSGRCIHTCRLHRDAAWALAVDADWRTAYSGGRDGAVIATDLGTWDSVLVACEQAPVVRLAAGREQLWCATTSSDVRSWPTAAVAEALRAGPAHGAAIDGGSWALRSSANGGSGSVSARRRLVTALAAKPLALIEGAAAVHSHTLLSDRWRVLAADTTGVVTLWDVLRCKPLATYGPGRSLDDVARELHVERAVPSWFSVDTRSGDLTIVLDERTAFAGLLYAEDIGLRTADVADDATVNLGWNALLNLFETWVAAQRGRSAGQGAPTAAGAAAAALGGARAQAAKQSPSVKLEASPEGVRFAILDGGRVAVRTTSSDAHALQAHEVPHWVSEALLAQRFYTREKAKVPFYVLPDTSAAAAGAGAPLSALVDGSSRLEALRILRIRQVIRYVAQNLATPLVVEAARGADGKAEPVNWEEHIEILCNERVLHPSVDLYSARLLVWRNPSDDLQLLYRRKTTPAPAPAR